MDLRRSAGAFLAVLGGLMIAVWAALFATDQVPEVHAAPVELALLLAAEMTTAVLSVVSGFALVTGKTWAYRAYLLASGMMLYAITNYLGVLAEGRQFPMVVLFTIFLLVTVVLLVETFERKGAGSTGPGNARRAIR